MKYLLGFAVCLVMVAGVSGSPTHVGADGEELDEDLPSPDGISMPEVQVVRFLGQRFPEMLDELEKAGAAGEEARAEVLDRARGIIFEWEEHFRVGEKVGENFIAVERLHYQSDRLVAEYVKMEEGPEKVAMGEKLRGNLAKVHDLRMEMEKAELERLKGEIAAVEENLKHSVDNRETMLETELRDLLEYWRLERAGQTAGRAREKPLIPGEVAGVRIPGVEDPEAEGTGTVVPGERIEVARPVEEEGTGGGFVEREAEGGAVDATEKDGAGDAEESEGGE